MACTREEKIIFQTFIETAARRMEVWKLTWDDVNIEKRAVQLWTKKNKGGLREGEWLPISSELAGQFKWWFDHRPIHSNYVFRELHYK